MCLAGSSLFDGSLPFLLGGQRRRIAGVMGALLDETTSRPRGWVRRGWERKELSPEFRLSAANVLHLPEHGLVCILPLRPAPSRGYLWLLGSTVILSSLSQTFQSSAGDREMSPSAWFGTHILWIWNTWMCLHAPCLHPAACIYIHLCFQMPVLPWHDRAYGAKYISPTGLLQGSWALQLWSSAYPGILAKEVVRAEEMEVLPLTVLQTFWFLKCIPPTEPILSCAWWWITSLRGDNSHISVPVRKCFFTALPAAVQHLSHRYCHFYSLSL